MSEVLYVDVLVVINIYINYGLLLMTCFIRKYNPGRIRLLLSALFGGFYSLIIVLPKISDGVVALSRIPAMIIILLIAFGFQGKGVFFRFLSVFITVNLLFAGAMFFIWYIFAPDNMYFNNGVVYFNIDTLSLVAVTAVVYLIVRIAGISAGTKAPENTVYRLILTIEGKEYEMKAIYDTGNSLSDPFSGEGVIIVDADKTDNIITADTFNCIDKIESVKGYKLIPVSTVSGTSLLPSVRADKAEIIGVDKFAEVSSPVIAFSKGKIFSGECGALLPSSIFDNINRTGDYYAEKIKKSDCLYNK